MVKIIWTDSAINDLDEIGEYIAKDSQRYAQITVSKLFESVDILELYPFAGAIVPEFDNNFIRQLIKGNYRIIYHIVDELSIDILTVHNCARLMSNSNPFDYE